MRRPLAALSVAAGFIALPLPARADPASAQRKAYDYALRCFVANGKQHEAGAKLAFDAAIKLGRLQGLTNRQVNEDFAQTIATESIKIARSEPYRQQLLSECKQLEMAS